MAIEVQGPDGAVHEFPDGTSPGVIKAAMAKRYGAPKGPPKKGFDVNPASRYMKSQGDLARGGLEAMQNAGSGRGPVSAMLPNDPAFKTLGGVGDFVAGAGQYLTSPISGAVDAFVAQPLEYGLGGPESRLGRAAGESARQFGDVALMVADPALAAGRAPKVPRLSAANVESKAVAIAKAPKKVQPRKSAAPKTSQKILQDEGINLTYGQMAGGIPRKLEDAWATTSPAIAKARGRGIDQLNRAVINKALKPIDETLSLDTPVGYDAIDEMITKSGNAVEDAYSTASFVPDEQFGQALKASAEENLRFMPREVKADAMALTERFLKNPLQDSGPLSGSGLSSALSQISRYKRNAYKSGQAQLGDYLSDLESEVLATVERSGSGNTEAIRNARQAYALTLRPERAAGSLGAQGGVFNPAQFDSAVKAFAGGARGRQYARGMAPMQEFSTAAKEILPPTIGSSGTAERLWGQNPIKIITSLAAETALGVAYSEPVLRLVNNVARSRNPVELRINLSALEEAAAVSPEAADALRRITNSGNLLGSPARTGLMSPGFDGSMQGLGVAAEEQGGPQEQQQTGFPTPTMPPRIQ